MATKTVTAPNFPVGTAVRAYPYESVQYERQVDREPINATAIDSGTIDSAHQVAITGSVGTYALLGVVNEVQSVAVDATSGQFKLVLSGQTTADIAFNASATTGGASVRALLEALSTVGTGNVTVSGGPGDSGGTTPYVVTFVEALAGTNVAAMTAAAGTTPLAGGGATVVITTSTAGTKQTTGTPLWTTFTIT